MCLLFLCSSVPTVSLRIIHLTTSVRSSFCSSVHTVRLLMCIYCFYVSLCLLSVCCSEPTVSLRSIHLMTSVRSSFYSSLPTTVQLKWCKGPQTKMLPVYVGSVKDLLLFLCSYCSSVPAVRLFLWAYCFFKKHWWFSRYASKVNYHARENKISYHSINWVKKLKYRKRVINKQRAKVSGMHDIRNSSYSVKGITENYSV